MVQFFKEKCMHVSLSSFRGWNRVETVISVFYSRFREICPFSVSQKTFGFTLSPYLI